MKILIVDDDAGYRDLLEVMLEPHGECTLAEDGREAVERFKTALDAGKPYDLVLMDIQMPHMDGQEALKRIRRLEKAVYGITLDNKNYAVIIMQTSVEDPKQFREAFVEGKCNGYITKPVEEGELLAKLKSHHLLP